MKNLFAIFFLFLFTCLGCDSSVVGGEELPMVPSSSGAGLPAQFGGYRIYANQNTGWFEFTSSTGDLELTMNVTGIHQYKTSGCSVDIWHNHPSYGWKLFYEGEVVYSTVYQRVLVNPYTNFYTNIYENGYSAGPGSRSLSKDLSNFSYWNNMNVQGQHLAGIAKCPNHAGVSMWFKVDGNG